MNAPVDLTKHSTTEERLASLLNRLEASIERLEQQRYPSGKYTSSSTKDGEPQ